MKREEAELLKEKYYAATATPEEQRRLAALLRSEACPEEWADERRGLLALLALEETSLPEGFGVRLAERLERERRTLRRVRLQRFVRAAVAAVVILIPATLLLRLALQQSPDTPPVAEAIKEAQKMEKAQRPAPVVNAGQGGMAEAGQVKKAEGRAQLKVAPKAVLASAAPERHERRQRAAKAESEATATPALAGSVSVPETPTPVIPDKAGQDGTPPETPGTEPSTVRRGLKTLPQTAASVEAQLERTRESRDRMMAEARAYMAGNCLDRRMPPMESEITEP